MTGHTLTIQVTDDAPPDWPFQRRWQYDRLTGPTAAVAFEEWVGWLDEHAADYDVDVDALTTTWRREHAGVRWTELHTFTEVES